MAGHVVSIHTSLTPGLAGGVGPMVIDPPITPGAGIALFALDPLNTLDPLFALDPLRSHGAGGCNVDGDRIGDRQDFDQRRGIQVRRDLYRRDRRRSTTTSIVWIMPPPSSRRPKCRRRQPAPSARRRTAR